ncbi:MAG: PilN domain-containing protein [Xanthobacteraceae bacterium]|jgi:general secretion pathway protein L
MAALRQIIDGFLRWIDSVAVTIIAAAGWLTSHYSVNLVEQEHGTFALKGSGRAERSLAGSDIRIVDGQVVGTVPEKVAAMLRGSRAELVLNPDRFLFRPLELPTRAGEFLEGIVRSQIDRLTPWSANDSVFGWAKPQQAGSDRMLVTVAATARALVTPYVQALTSLGIKSIAVSTLLPGPEPVPVKVLDEKGHSTFDAGRVRRVLLTVLLIAGLGAAVAVIADSVIGSSLQAEQDQLARRIASRRAAGLGGREGSLDAATAGLRALERRKHDGPSVVIVLEQLSQVLPDHTYVTELRVEGDKLRLIGVTRDAPSLIGLIEQTQHFSRATFFAPTTRSPNESGERFHIEARIEPSFAPRS